MCVLIPAAPRRLTTAVLAAALAALVAVERPAQAATIDEILGVTPGANYDRVGMNRVIDRLPVKHARLSTQRLRQIWQFNAPPGTSNRDRVGPASGEWPLDRRMKEAFANGSTPIINLISPPGFERNESNGHQITEIPDAGWYWIGRRFAERYRPGSAWNQQNTSSSFGATTYMLFNEINASWYNDFDPQLRRTTYENFANVSGQFARGVRHGFGNQQGQARVYMGPLTEAEVSVPNYDFSAEQFVKKVADEGLFDPSNPNHLDGFGVHSYPATANSDAVRRSKMNVPAQVQRIKEHAGIENVPLDFYNTEFNVELSSARNTNEIGASDEDLAARMFFSQIWLNLAVANPGPSNASPPATVAALAFSPFPIGEGQWVSLSRYSSYPWRWIADRPDNFRLNSWQPNRRGRALQLAARLGQGMTIERVNTDLSLVVASGQGKKLWALNNLRGITSLENNQGQTGLATNFELVGIPDGVTTVRVYYYDSVNGGSGFNNVANANRTINIANSSEYQNHRRFRVHDLRTDQTIVFVAE